MRIEFERHCRKKEVIAVHFGSDKKYCWAVPDGMDIQTGDVVWVDTNYGEELAEVVAVTDSRGIAVRNVIGRITSIEVE